MVVIIFFLSLLFLEAKHVTRLPPEQQYPIPAVDFCGCQLVQATGKSFQANIVPGKQTAAFPNTVELQWPEHCWLDHQG